MASNNSATRRSEVSIEGKTAFLDYHLTPRAIKLIHTEVPAAMREHCVAA
jgi:predicted GNAT family acetyltransferase